MRGAANLFYSLLLLLVLFLSMAGSSARADTRVALVIGNGAYRNAQHLPNPTNDAQDVAASLKRAGFETFVGLDLDQAGMQAVAIKFAKAARGADVAIFYYSGHAMQFAGTNYLMPIDATLNDEADLRRMTKVDEIVDDLQQARNLRILVLDSCRDNPLAEQLKRSIGKTRGVSIERGLAKLDTPQGMIVAYSTQSGRTAEDGTGRNSPYTKAFLKHIEEPEEIGTVFRRVSADVYEDTSRAQLPELSLSLIGEFYLRGRMDVTVKQLPSAVDPCAAAADHWKSAEAIGTQAAFEDHLARFPNCAFAGLARARSAAIEKAAADLKPAEEGRRQLATIAPSKPALSPCGGPMVASLSSRAAKPLSAAEECALAPKTVFKECDQCPVMVVVPAGSFKMGSPSGEWGSKPSEYPQHEVTLPKSFAVGRFAVTFDEWDACVADKGCNGYNPSDAYWGRGQRPAIYISWDDAQAYTAWLSRKTGKSYRLLNEAEREYVARAGTTSRFWSGASMPANGVNYNDASQIAGKGAYQAKTVPVDSFSSNPWGLYQVYGNVAEWVEDCWHENYWDAPTDGTAWTSKTCSDHVLRGDSWWSHTGLGSASRGKAGAASRTNTVGFRVARSIDR